MSDTPEQPQELFDTEVTSQPSMVSAIVGTVLWTLVVLAMLTDMVVNFEFSFNALLVIIGLILVPYASIKSIFARRFKLGTTGVEAYNHFRRITVPWEAVTRIRSNKYMLVLDHEGGRLKLQLRGIGNEKRVREVVAFFAGRRGLTESKYTFMDTLAGQFTDFP